MTNFYKMIETIRFQGIKAAWKQYRWKLLAVIFFYYLVRDLTLYVILPFLLYKVAI